MTVDEIVGSLTRMRKRSGLLQKDVAEMMHVTRPLVSMLESGKRVPRLDTLLAYADAVGAEIAVARIHEGKL